MSKNSHLPYRGFKMKELIKAICNQWLQQTMDCVLQENKDMNLHSVWLHTRIVKASVSPRRQEQTYKYSSLGRSVKAPESITLRLLMFCNVLQE